MRLFTAVVLVICLLPVSEQITNFESYPIIFMTADAITQNWQYSAALGTAVLLSALAAAQYGFLPIRPSRLVAKKESRSLTVHPAAFLYQRSRRDLDSSLGRRQVKAVTRPELMDVVVRAALLLGEAARRYGTAQGAI